MNKFYTIFYGVNKYRKTMFYIVVIMFVGIGFPNDVISKEVVKTRSLSKGIVLQNKPKRCGEVKEPRVPQRPPNRSIVYENLIDQIDVYALSPHAKKIALPCMVSPTFREKIAAMPIDWSIIIQEASVRHNLDPALIAAVIKVESGFSVKAISSKGAKGLMQVMPGTASELGVVDIFNPAENVDAGSRYLRQQLDRFGCLELALAAYNAGPGAVTKYNGIPPYKETQLFVKKVLSEI